MAENAEGRNNLFDDAYVALSTGIRKQFEKMDAHVSDINCYGDLLLILK